MEIAALVAVIVGAIILGGADTEKEGGQSLLCIGICAQTSSDHVVTGDAGAKAIDLDVSVEKKNGDAE
jgi:hypothetical protein